MRLALFAAALAAAGCGRTGSVSGTVTVGGTAAPGGAVAFIPVGGGPTATGQIDKDGRYSVVVGAGDGLPPGEYKVTVVAHGDPPAFDPTKGAPPAPRPLSAPQFRDAGTTPLTKTVTAGANVIDLAVDPVAADPKTMMNPR